MFILQKSSYKWCKQRFKDLTLWGRCVFEEATEPSVYSSDKNLWVLREINVEDQLDTKIRDASEAAQRERRRGHMAPRRKEERKRFCLQFGHPGGVEAHGHTGGAGSVPHLPQHAAPLLLISLVPNQSKSGVTSPNKRNDKALKTRCGGTYCQTSVTSVGATSLFSIWTMAKPPTAYREPPLLSRLTELLSWGNSVKGSHLRRQQYHVGHMYGSATKSNKKMHHDIM